MILGRISLLDDFLRSSIKGEGNALVDDHAHNCCLVPFVESKEALLTVDNGECVETVGVSEGGFLHGKTNTHKF